MIDTHAHIYDEKFLADEQEMMHRIQLAEVKQIWMPNCNQETIEPMLAWEKKYPEMCLPMMGLHPCYVDENFENELQIVGEWLAKRPFLMIGEIGLDFYWDLTFVPQQEKAFVAQLELAKKYQLPICIHSRSSKDGQLNAITRACELIESFGWDDLRGIFHCFSGNLEDAKRIIDLNFLLGIGGVVTYKNGGVAEVIAQIDIHHLVLETDAPYLAPVPHRGKRNEVAFVAHVAEKVAQVKQMPLQEVIQQTSANALRLVHATQYV